MQRFDYSNYTAREMHEARQALGSLFSKSNKARQKVASGTWQHAMLTANLKALHIASTLMNEGRHNPHSFSADDLQQALAAFASMIGKTEKAQARFSPGTSQHTLQGNSRKALRIARDVISGSTCTSIAMRT